MLLPAAFNFAIVCTVDRIHHTNDNNEIKVYARKVHFYTHASSNDASGSGVVGKLEIDFKNEATLLTNRS